MENYNQNINIAKYSRKLGWSVSRVEKLNYCQRKYCYEYYPETIKAIDFNLYLDALLIKNLSSLSVWVGEKVHSEIAEILKTLKRQNDIVFDSKDYLDKRFPEIKNEMINEFRKSELKDYSNYDKNNKFGLIEHLNKTANKVILNESIEFIYECISAFFNFEYFSLISEKIRKCSNYIESKDWDIRKYNSNNFPSIDLWISPDFWLEYESNRFVIFDWKTGEKPSGSFSVDFANEKPLIAYAYRLYNEVTKYRDESNSFNSEIQQPIIEGYYVYLPDVKPIGGVLNFEEILNFESNVIKKDLEILSEYLYLQTVDNIVPKPLIFFKKTEHLKKCDKCAYKERLCSKI